MLLVWLLLFLLLQLLLSGIHTHKLFVEYGACVVCVNPNRAVAR